MKFETTITTLEDTLSIQEYLLTLIPQIQAGAKFSCVIDIQREKRSINANNYSWLLQGKIAKILNRRIDDVHNEMVLQYGVIEVYSIVKEAFESAKRIFDYFEVLGESETNGKTFIHVKAGLGTHTYNTLEMSKFIDGVVQEAQDLGIETKTPDEIAELKSLWEQGQR